MRRRFLALTFLMLTTASGPAWSSSQSFAYITYSPQHNSQPGRLLKKCCQHTTTLIQHRHTEAEPAEGVYYVDAIDRRKRLVLPSAACHPEIGTALDSRWSATSFRRQSLKALREQLDFGKIFVPYANSRVAISPNGRWLAVSGLSIHFKHSHYPIIERQHYRILLVDLESSSFDSTPPRVIKLFDSFDWHQRYRQHPEGMVRPWHEVNYDEQDQGNGSQRLHFDLDREFVSNPFHHHGDPLIENFVWGPDARIELSFSADSARLRFRVFSQDWVDGHGFFSGPFKTIAPAHQRRDLGPHRSFLVELPSTTTTDNVANLWRTFIPNEVYLSALTQVPNRSNYQHLRIGTYILSPDRQHLVRSHLVASDVHNAPLTYQPETKFTDFTHLLEVESASSQCDNSASLQLEGVACRKKGIALVKYDTIDAFFPFMKFFDNGRTIVFRDSPLHLGWFSFANITAQEVEFLATDETILAQLATGHLNVDRLLADTTNQRLQPMGKPMLRTDDPKLTVVGQLPLAKRYTPERFSTYLMHLNLRDIMPPLEVAADGDTLVAIQPAIKRLSRALDRYHDIRGFTDTQVRLSTRAKQLNFFHPERSYLDLFQGVGIVYSQSTRTVGHLVYPLARYSPTPNGRSMWQTLHHPNYRPPTASNPSKFALGRRLPLQMMLGASLRKPTVRSKEGYIYFLEHRLSDGQPFLADLAKQPWPMLSRIPIHQRDEGLIERLSNQGWLTKAQHRQLNLRAGRQQALNKAVDRPLLRFLFQEELAQPVRPPHFTGHLIDYAIQPDPSAE